MRFEQKVVVVTGAAGGIGRAVASAFAREGAMVHLTDLDEAAVKALANALREEGWAASAVAADLATADGCETVIASAVENHGALHVLINNAGYMCRGPIDVTTDAMWETSFSVNVTAVFRLCRAALPHLESAGGGAIVNTASTWGIYPGPDHLAYCTSKGAVAALTRSLARDLAPRGIRVNAVCPNEVNTPMIRSGFEIRGLDADNAIAELNRTVPLGRIAEPEDIADVILFLASDAARYMAGSLVEVNGAKPVY